MWRRAFVLHKLLQDLGFELLSNLCFIFHLTTFRHHRRAPPRHRTCSEWNDCDNFHQLNLGQLLEVVFVFFIHNSLIHVSPFNFSIFISTFACQKNLYFSHSLQLCDIRKPFVPFMLLFLVLFFNDVGNFLRLERWQLLKSSPAKMKGKFPLTNLERNCRSFNGSDKKLPISPFETRCSFQ